MTYSKLGNIKGPQGRRGLNMTGGATTPPTAGEDVLEGDLWLDSVTGDVYRATDPWSKDDSWHTWNTVLWKVADNTLMVQPLDGDTGTMGEGGRVTFCMTAPWCDSSINPSRDSMTSVRSKGNVVVGENSGALFFYNKSLTDLSSISNWNVSSVTDMGAMFNYCLHLADLSPISNWDVSGVTGVRGIFQGCESLTDLSPVSNWNISGVTDMGYMFDGCTSLTDISALSGWDMSSVTDMGGMFQCCDSLTDISPLSGWNMSGVTIMGGMFNQCPLERIGVPSLEHGGRNFVSKLKDASAVTSMDTTMLTNTTTHETMSANQIIADMDANPSKYSTGTIWTL